MELPLSYSFSKHNKFTLTNSKSSSILHVCGNLNLSTLSEIQDLLLNNVERKNYSEEDFNNLLTELYTENNQNYDLENIDDIDLEDIASSISPSEDLLDDKNETYLSLGEFHAMSGLRNPIILPVCRGESSLLLSLEEKENPFKGPWR